MPTTAFDDAAFMAALKIWMGKFAAPVVPGPTGPTGPGGATSAPSGPTAGPTGASGPTAAPAPTAASGPPAPSVGGLPQYSDLFTKYGYSVRPPFQVPGVDYLVGIKPGVVLKNPRTAVLPVGVSYYAAGNQINVQANDVVLDGWDFSGLQLLLAGPGPAERLTTRNCRFNISDPAINAGWSTGTDILMEYCDITGSNTNSGTINWAPRTNTSKLTVQYCYFHDNPGDGPNLKNGGTFIFRNNVVHNQALGGLGHLDQLVAGDGPLSFQPCFINNNLFLDDGFIAAGNGTQGLSLDGNYHSTAFVSRGGEIKQNVWINRTTGGGDGSTITYGIRLESTLTLTGTTWQVAENYIDDAGYRGFGWNFCRNTLYGPQRGVVALTGNVDLRTNTKPVKFNGTVS